MIGTHMTQSVDMCIKKSLFINVATVGEPGRPCKMTSKEINSKRNQKNIGNVSEMSDAKKLRIIAAWFENLYPNTEVPDDLRRIAARLEAMDKINDDTEYLPSMTGHMGE
jgi:hypothetical protein